MGIPTQKCPLDMWIYQEIIFKTKPDLLIETGTAYGGSALFFATFMDTIGHGHVATVDVLDVPGRPQHPRITYLLGSSTSEESIERIRQMAENADSIMVILDSDHSRDHVAKELRLYCDLVTPGNYLVVEDSNVNGHPVNRTHGPGPMEALGEFLATNSDFSIDSYQERYMMTFNPKGYLKRAE
jgi:cephalosporin hydroxylase